MKQILYFCQPGHVPQCLHLQYGEKEAACPFGEQAAELIIMDVQIYQQLDYKLSYKCKTLKTVTGYKILLTEYPLLKVKWKDFLAKMR